MLYESCLSGCTAGFFLVSSHYKQATYMQENQNGLRRRVPLVPQHTAYPCSLVMIDIYILNTTTDAILLCHSSISSEYLSVYGTTEITGNVRVALLLYHREAHGRRTYRIDRSTCYHKVQCARRSTNRQSYRGRRDWIRDNGHNTVSYSPFVGASDGGHGS